MDDKLHAINSLLKPSGKSADEMTHLLKLIGNGDMQTGIKKIAVQYSNDKLKIVIPAALLFGAGILKLIHVESATIVD